VIVGTRYKVKFQKDDEMGRKAGTGTFEANYLGTNYAGHHLFDARPEAGTITLPQSMILVIMTTESPDAS